MLIEIIRIIRLMRGEKVGKGFVLPEITREFGGLPIGNAWGMGRGKIIRIIKLIKKVLEKRMDQV